MFCYRHTVLLLCRIDKGLRIMYCELKDKDVEITPVQKIKDSKGNIVSTLYTCNGGNVEINGITLKKACNMMRKDSACLLCNMR